MKKSSKKSSKTFDSKVRFNYRSEEGFLCLALDLERKIGRYKFIISMFEDSENSYIDIVSQYRGVSFYTYIVDTIVDCVKRTVKYCGVFFEYSFDCKDGKPYCHIICSKNNPLPF